jgi:hypothetical protein
LVVRCVVEGDMDVETTWTTERIIKSLRVVSAVNVCVPLASYS